MTRQIINTGTSELAGDGESIRSAFVKVNSNFLELYTTGGPIGYTGSQGVSGFVGSRGSTGTVGFVGSAGTVGFVGSAGSTGTVGFTGSQGPAGPSNFTNIASNVLPSANLTYDLGSTSSQWRSLYVGTSTIYLGGNTLSIINGNLSLNSNPITAASATTSTLANGTYTVSLSNLGILTLPFNAVLKDNNFGSVSFGNAAGLNNQSGPNVAIGANAAENDQLAGAVAIGYRAGRNDQGTGAVAVGLNAASISQRNNAVSVGSGAGNTNQSTSSVAIGSNSGYQDQGLQSVAIGNLAGSVNQGQRAVAVGSLAGSNNQGQYAVALGNFAGGNNQPANSIVINASGIQLNGSTAGLFVDPIRADAQSSATTHILYYNPGTKEITTSSLTRINVPVDEIFTITTSFSVLGSPPAGPTSFSWEFYPDGYLILPTGGGISTQLDENFVINVNATVMTSPPGPVSVEYIFNGSGQLEFPNTNFGLTPGITTLGYTFDIATDNGVTWRFDGAGKLTFPDNTFQETAYRKTASTFNATSPTVDVDNFRAQIDGSGNPAVGGIFSNFTCTYTLNRTLYTGGTWNVSAAGATATNFTTAFASGLGTTFTTVGDQVVGTFQDLTFNRIYKVTWIKSSAGANGNIIVERLM